MPYPPKYPRSSKPEKDRPDANAFLSNAVTRIGQIVALLAGLAIIAILVDQGRHLFSSTYTHHQRTKHEFMCYSHSRTVEVAQGASELDARRAEIEQNVYVLMDVVRQQNAPTEFFGKLRLFALCSSFSKAGFGGFEVSGARGGGQSALRIGGAEAQSILSDLAELQAFYPDWPDLAGRQLACELRRIQSFDQLPNAVCEDGEFRHTPQRTVLAPLSNRLFPCALTTEGLCQPAPDGLNCNCQAPAVSQSASAQGTETVDVWLLVVGGDKTDEAAISQVEITRRILQESKLEPVPDEDVQLRLLRGWRRTVVVFETESEARKALIQLGEALPFGGYVRNQSEWCPDLQVMEPLADGITTKLCAS